MARHKRLKGSSRGKNRHTGLIILLVILIIAACIGIFLYLFRDNYYYKRVEQLVNSTTSILNPNISPNELDASLFTTDENGYMDYESDTVTTLTGTDVSQFQGDIDWQAVKDSGIEFAIIRVGFRGYGTEGTLNIDEKFVTNIEGALDAGLQVGVYFFSQSITVEEAEAEADFVLDAIKNYDITLPVAYDWESVQVSGSRTASVSSDMMTSMAEAFCSKISDAGYATAIYYNQTDGYYSLDLSQLSSYQFWLAQYQDTPDFYYSIDIWQYSDSGTIPGISAAADLDLYFIKISD